MVWGRFGIREGDAARWGDVVLRQVILRALLFGIDVAKGLDGAGPSILLT